MNLSSDLLTHPALPSRTPFEHLHAQLTYTPRTHARTAYRPSAMASVRQGTSKDDRILKIVCANVATIFLMSLIPRTQQQNAMLAHGALIVQCRTVLPGHSYLRERVTGVQTTTQRPSCRARLGTKATQTQLRSWRKSDAALSLGQMTREASRRTTRTLVCPSIPPTLQLHTLTATTMRAISLCETSRRVMLRGRGIQTTSVKNRSLESSAWFATKQPTFG